MGIAKAWDLWLVLSFFYLLLLASLCNRRVRQSMFSRSISEWFLDVQGLIVQGWCVPLARTFVLFVFFQWLLPGWQGRLKLPSFVAFALAFVLVDYAYYWNHRILHHRTLWSLHRIHHAALQLDLFTSARNSLWTPFLLVYIWLHGFFVFILNDPLPYILGAAMTAALDLWRHSPSLSLTRPGRLSLLKHVLLTPDEHAWHHSIPGMASNFGANLNIWDKLHGTYQLPQSLHLKVGWHERQSLLQQWLTPWNTR